MTVENPRFYGTLPPLYRLSPFLAAGGWVLKVRCDVQT